MNQKRQLIEKEKLEKAQQDELMAQIEREMTEARTKTDETEDYTERNFQHTFALIYCNSDYEELN